MSTQFDAIKAHFQSLKGLSFTFKPEDRQFSKAVAAKLKRDTVIHVRPVQTIIVLGVVNDICTCSTSYLNASMKTVTQIRELKAATVIDYMAQAMMQDDAYEHVPPSNGGYSPQTKPTVVVDEAVDGTETVVKVRTRKTEAKALEVEVAPKVAPDPLYKPKNKKEARQIKQGKFVPVQPVITEISDEEMAAMAQLESAEDLLVEA